MQVHGTSRPRRVEFKSLGPRNDVFPHLLAEIEYADRIDDNSGSPLGCLEKLVAPTGSLQEIPVDRHGSLLPGVSVGATPNPRTIAYEREKISFAKLPLSNT